jgi:hypothetical protein
MKPAYLVVFACALVLAACGPSISSSDDDDDGDGGTNTCSAGQQRCQGNVLQSCQGGQFADAETCGMACDPTLGCVVCVPNTGTCNGDISMACRSDGQGFIDVYCDPVQGISCGPSGTCEGACAPASLGETYVGCDYWPTITGNMVSAQYDFAVAVSNTTNLPTEVTIDGGALTVPDVFTVAANSVSIRRLPWVAALKLCVGQSWSNCNAAASHPNAALAAAGAYHLRSKVPVTVYQFNPLDYVKTGATENSYTNDASLLFPSNAWRYDYYVAAWPHTASVSPSLMAVTAYQDGTNVTITTRAATTAAGGAPAFTAGVPQMVTLNKGDVIELGTAAADLTGSRVTSDKPVQVIGGHYCANVPDGFGYCDHLEESMFPVDALSNRYIVNAPAVTTIPNGKEEIVRIIATQAGTTLTYDPPQAGAPTTIANAGDFVEIARQAASYMITANHKVMVAQLMEGSSVAGGTGDPAMALAVPIEQYRSYYLFHAPTNYLTNYVDITAPMGATVTLDGPGHPARQRPAQRRHPLDHQRHAVRDLGVRLRRRHQLLVPGRPQPRAGADRAAGPAGAAAPVRVASAVRHLGLLSGERASTSLTRVRPLAETPPARRGTHEEAHLRSHLAPRAPRAPRSRPARRL